MIEDAKDFINDWVCENINAEAYASDGDNARARELADQCRADAKAQGISEQEIETAVGDMVGGGNGLVAFIAEAMDSATDAEVNRLAEKDR